MYIEMSDHQAKGRDRENKPKYEIMNPWENLYVRIMTYYACICVDFYKMWKKQAARTIPKMNMRITKQ